MVRCNKHNVEENAKIDLNLIFGKYGEVGACRCEQCRKVYIDVKGLKSGDLGTLTKNYKLSNQHKYIDLPKTLYVLNNNHFSKLLSKSKNLIYISEFTADNYEKTINIVTRYDPDNDRYYISKNILTKKMLRIVDKYQIKLIYFNNINQLDLINDIDNIPDIFYVIESSQLTKLENRIILEDKTNFVDKKGNIYSINAKYNKNENVYYISKKDYIDCKDVLNELSIKVIQVNNMNAFVENYKYHDMPSKMFLLDKCDLQRLTDELSLIECAGFIDNNKNDYYIPTKYDKKNRKYYITYGTSETFLNTLKKLNIELEELNLDDNINLDNVYNSVDFENFKQSKRVAEAYKSANIVYNPYQYLPWLYLYNENCSNILISDEVGLGKTIEAGILINQEIHDHPNNNILIVCPAFLKNKWRDELKQKFYLNASIFNEEDSNNKLMILPVSRLKRFNEENKIHYHMVIVDEAHYFKNSKSARYTHLSNLLQKNKSNHKVFMSATPINNTANDYYSISKLLDKQFAITSTTKRQAYIDIHKRNVKEVYVDLNENEQNIYDVTDALDPFSGTIYRHIGSSCLYALKKYAEKYSNDESEVKQELRNSLEELLSSDYDDLNEIESFHDNLSKYALSGVDSKLKKLNELIESIEDKKIVIFSHYIETLKYLKSELSQEYRCEYIYGNNFSNNNVFTDKKNRFKDAKTWFDQKDLSEKTILICSDSCKEGIDLDEASCLINYDLPFNPSILEQRIGRIDRMCQKQDMTIFNFHVNDTYDDRLHMILSSKLLIINYYSEYGVGNPLSIVEDGTSPFDKFIMYFRKHEKLSLTNDDYSVIKKILRKVDVKVKKDVNQTEILQLLVENKNKIIDLFDDKEIDLLTEEQLRIQKDILDKKLGFPSHNSGALSFDSCSKRNLAETINNNPYLRIKLSCIINDYERKIKDIEDTGNPMILSEVDIKSSLLFSSNAAEKDVFISSDVIEILKTAGAKVYAN